MWLQPFIHPVKQPTLVDYTTIPDPTARLQVNPALASRFLSVVRQSAAPVIDVFINPAAKAKGNKKRGADVCSCTPDYGVEWMVGEPAERRVQWEFFARVTQGLAQGPSCGERREKVGWRVMT